MWMCWWCCLHNARDDWRRRRTSNQNTVIYLFRGSHLQVQISHFWVANEPHIVRVLSSFHYFIFLSSDYYFHALVFALLRLHRAWVCAPEVAVNSFRICVDPFSVSVISTLLKLRSCALSAYRSLTATLNDEMDCVLARERDRHISLCVCAFHVNTIHQLATR